MTQNKEFTFFIQPPPQNLIKAFLSREKERYAEIQKQHAQEMMALKELTESNYKKEIDSLRQLMVATLTQLKKYRQEQNQQGASSAQEDLLFKECSNTALKNMLPSIIDDFTEREKTLKEQLVGCKDTVNTLKNMYSSMVDDYISHESQMQSENEKLQRELQQLKEKELEQKLREAEDRLRLETDLKRREKELESRERGTAKKEQEIQTTGVEHNLHSNVELTSPGLSQAQCGSLEEDLRRKDDDSHDSKSLESGKPVRRNSNPFELPNMTGSEHGPLDTL